MLGITQQPGKSVSESVAAALQVLVISNCEHVLEAAADLIDAILAQSTTVRVLATSREVLGMAQVPVVRSAVGLISGIDASGAVRLFVERAEGIAPGFSMTQR